MPVSTGQSLERETRREEADIAEIVQGFLSIQARTAGPGIAARPRRPMRKACARERNSRSSTSLRVAIPPWLRDSPGASTPGPESTPLR